MKHLLENTFLLILITIGGIGIAFSFGSSTENDVNSAISSATIQSTGDEEAIFGNPEPLLDVNGIQEIGSELQFEVKNFNKNAEYLMDFGNGTKKRLNRKKQSYTYENSGDFNLRLFITYNGKTKLVHKETINIDRQVVASSEMSTVN